MPIDPYRNVSKASPVIKALAVQVYTMTRRTASSIWIGRGWDTASSGSVEHNSGRALDIMVARNVGRLPSSSEFSAGVKVVGWLIRNADALHIRHIIWDRKIWKRRYRGTKTEWSNLTGRKGISDWHQDHIHVYLDDVNGKVPSTPLSDDTPTTSKKDDLMATPEERRQLITDLLSTNLGASGPAVGLALQSAYMATRPAEQTRRFSEIETRINGLEEKLDELLNK